MRLGDLDELKKDFKDRLEKAKNWKENALNRGDEEIVIRADATINFICEVIMTIDNAQTVDTDEIYKKGYHNGFFATHDVPPTVEPETKVVANVTFDKEQMEELVEKAKADILARIERPRGEWKHIVEEDNDVECPFCGFQEDGIYYNFCPSCGADMRGEEE